MKHKRAWCQKSVSCDAVLTKTNLVCDSFLKNVGFSMVLISYLLEGLVDLNNVALLMILNELEFINACVSCVSKDLARNTKS